MQDLPVWFKLLDHLNSRIQWLLLMLTFSVWSLFTFYLFPSIDYNKFGQSIKILDVRLFYSSADMQQLFEMLGKEGRALYWFQAGVIDMLYPIVYGLFLIFLILRFKSKGPITKWKSYWYYAVLLTPLLDCLENFNTLVALSIYPGELPWLALTGSFFSSFKWLMAFAALGLAFRTVWLRLWTSLNAKTFFSLTKDR